jgi:hypothetical protein
MGLPTIVQTKQKMSKKSSVIRGNRTPTTGITDRALSHERGCRGICPDLGEPLLEEANHSFKSRAGTAANPMRQPTNKRKSRSIIIDDEPDINIAATWIDAPATATIDDEITAPTTAARATEPLTASKRIKLPDTNKRKAVCLEPTDVLQVKIGRQHALYILAVVVGYIFWLHLPKYSEYFGHFSKYHAWQGRSVVVGAPPRVYLI